MTHQCMPKIFQGPREKTFRSSSYILNIYRFDEKVESILFSVFTKISTLSCIINFKLSNLLDTELILRFLMTNLRFL